LKLLDGVEVFGMVMAGWANWLNEPITIEEGRTNGRD
jgi:hypothetical protein